MSCSITLKIVLKKGLKLLEKKQKVPKRQKRGCNELDRRAWGKPVGYKEQPAESGGTKKGRKEEKRVLGW